MRLYKRSDTWWMDLSVDGQRIRQSTGSTDKEEAELVAQEVARKVRLARLGLLPEEPEEPERPRVPLSEFAEKYVRFMRMTFSETPRTAEGAHSAFQSLRHFFGARDPVLDEISVGDVEAWKVYVLDGRSGNTLAIHYRALHAAWNRAVNWNDATDNPFSRAERPKEIHGRDVRYFENEELLKLLEAAEAYEHPRFLKMILFYLYTGARRNELIHLEWKDLDLEAREVHIAAKKPRWNHRTKTGRSRRVPICEPLHDLILELWEARESDQGLKKSSLVFPVPRGSNKSTGGRYINQPYHEDRVTRKFRRLVDKTGLPRSLTLHSLRHTFASNLVQRGVSLYIVGELLGHTDLEVTRIYSHLTPRSYGWVVDYLDFRPNAVKERIENQHNARADAFDRARMERENRQLRAEIVDLKRQLGALKTG